MGGEADAAVVGKYAAGMSDVDEVDEPRDLVCTMSFHDSRPATSGEGKGVISMVAVSCGEVKADRGDKDPALP